jgi:hypothetical protein
MAAQAQPCWRQRSQPAPRQWPQRDEGRVAKMLDLDLTINPRGRPRKTESDESFRPKF